MDTTILYYSSNREKPELEQKIINSLLEVSGDLPIISISHKPLELGKNICVGEQGASGFNMFRQILIGMKEATTKYIITAEADCVYGPDYFQFTPDRDDKCYRNSNTYLMGLRRDYFYKKPEGGSWCTIINREFYIKRLEYLFGEGPEWSVEEKNFPKERQKGEDIFPKKDIVTHFTKEPCISIKTSQGMRHYSHSERDPIYNIPYWGDSRAFRAKYL